MARAELDKFVKEGPTDAELEQSKKNITGGFPLRTASNGDIVSYISMIGFYGMPLTYLDTFTGTIDKITREEVMDAYRRRLHPDTMLTVIVGKKVAKEVTQITKTKATKTKDGESKGENGKEKANKAEAAKTEAAIPTTKAK